MPDLSDSSLFLIWSRGTCASHQLTLRKVDLFPASFADMCLVKFIRKDLGLFPQLGHWQMKDLSSFICSKPGQCCGCSSYSPSFAVRER